MELVLITYTEDAGESHTVEVFRGWDERGVIGSAFDRYEELIGEFCEERQIDAGQDDRISEGAEVDGHWYATMNPEDHNWRTGFIEWKFRESGDNYTIRLYGDNSRYQPVLKVHEVR